MIEDDDAVWHIFDDQVLEKTKYDESDVTLCPHCKDTNIVLLDANYICLKCHSVLDRFIDTSAEWRYYGCDDNKSNDPTRCGMPTNDLLPESSMGAMIGFSMNDSYAMRLIRKYHMWNCMTYKERSLYNIFDILTVNAVNNGIPKSILEEAKMFYKKLSEVKITRGDNRSGLIASSIYMSCKNNKVPRSAKEIAKIFNLKLKTMTKGCKKFQEIMKLDMDSTNPDDFIARFCSRLGVDANLRDICKNAVKKADELEILCENTPTSIAAGSIFLCSTMYGWGITKKDIAETCETSQVTINKCYKQLYQHRHMIFPDSVTEESPGKSGKKVAT